MYVGNRSRLTDVFRYYTDGTIYSETYEESKYHTHSQHIDDSCCAQYQHIPHCACKNMREIDPYPMDNDSTCEFIGGNRCLSINLLATSVF